MLRQKTCFITAAVFLSLFIFSFSAIAADIPAPTNAAAAPENNASTITDLSSRGILDNYIGQRIVEYAKIYLGTRYRSGGSTPKGFDCSGFVRYVYKYFDINLAHCASSQAKLGKKVAEGDLKPGDLLFFDTNGRHKRINHVGIYIGGNRFINAESGSLRRVVISSLNEEYWANTYMYAKRIVT